MALLLKSQITRGTRLWVPLTVKKRAFVAREAEDWVPAVAYEDALEDKPEIAITYERDDENPRVDEDEVVTVKKDGLLVRNPTIQDGIDDLTAMSYMHDPAVLYCLRVRYQLDQIYSYSGPILIAVNPYRDIEGLYTKEMMDSYVGYRLGKLSPHIFAIAEEAFRSMQTQNNSQSILVSGESGAGKTETTKYVLRYLAAMSSEGGSASSASQSTSLAMKVLKSTPILEAFGNARTRFNNNSSRFGKFIEIWFSPERYAICGSALRTYLLEKSRVVKPATSERNFHIFYQLLAAEDRNLKARINLAGASAKDFYYTEQSGCYTVDGIDDAEVYEATCSALDVLGISRKEQEDMFRIIAAILHLGNVTFTESGKEEARIVENEDDAAVLKSATASKNAPLNVASSLLGCNAKLIEKSFLTREITVGNETLVKPLDKEKAENSRDSLSMLLYSNLFDWLVARINTALKDDPQAVSYRSKKGSKSGDNLLIGILDIYGFECFDTNGFPQFCINYANEKLQNHFIHFIFKREQQEYIKQKIDWSYIEFRDNEGCIDLLENKKLSVLALLEEECRFPKGTDLSFAEKVRKEHKHDPFFAEPRFSRSAFSIKHFAGLVDYETSTGFLDKNRDYMVPAQVEVLKNAKNDFVAQVSRPSADTGKMSDSGSVKTKMMSMFQKDTTSNFKFVGVVTQFKESLAKLMETISATEPHFVRCIKPNAAQVPNRFDKPLVLNQLRSGGVMEAVRVTSAGYPSRTNYRKFYDRYKILAKHATNADDERSSCKNLLAALDIKDTESGRNVIQLGTTKIFMKAGVIANLEKMRVDRLNACAAVFQKHWKRKMQYRLYQAQKAAALKIETYARMYLAKKELYQLKKEKASLILQAALRRHHERKRYKAIREAAVTVQWIFRGVSVERKRLEELRLAKEKRDNARKVLVNAVRVWRARIRHEKLIRATILAQARWRGRKQRKRFVVLLREWRAEEKRKRQEAKRLKKEEEERKRKEEEERVRLEKKERKKKKKEELARQEEERKKAKQIQKEQEARLRAEEEERVRLAAEEARKAQEKAKAKRQEEKKRKRELEELEAEQKRQAEERQRLEEAARKEQHKAEKKARKAQEEEARLKRKAEKALENERIAAQEAKEKEERRARKQAEAARRTAEEEEQKRKDAEIRRSLEELVEQLRREVQIRDEKIAALTEANGELEDAYRSSSSKWKKADKSYKKEIKKRDKQIGQYEEELARLAAENESAQRENKDKKEDILLEKQKREFLEETTRKMREDVEQEKKRREEKKAKEKEEAKEQERLRKEKKKEMEAQIEKLDSDLLATKEELRAEQEAKHSLASEKKLLEISMEKERVFLEGKLQEQAANHEAALRKLVEKWEAKYSQLEASSGEAQRKNNAQIDALRHELDKAFGQGEQSEQERKRAEDEIERSRLQFEANRKAEEERIAQLKSAIEQAKLENERLVEKRKRSEEESKIAIDELKRELANEKQSKESAGKDVGERTIALEKLNERYNALESQHRALSESKKKKISKLKDEFKHQQSTLEAQAEALQKKFDILEAERRQVEEEAERRVIVLNKTVEDIAARLQQRKEEREAERQLLEEESKESTERYEKRLADQEQKHELHIQQISKQMSEKFSQIERMKAEWDGEWKDLNKLKEAECKRLEEACNDVTSDLQAEKERRKLVERDLRETKRKHRIQLRKLQRATERERRNMVSRMSRDEADVEMLTTMLGGNSEEGKKMLIGYVIAEERGFSNAIPVPALVIYRFLRYWDEISYKVVLPNAGNNKMSIYGFAVNSQNISFLLSYTISSFKALLHMASTDTSLLCYCLANYAFMLHALLKDRTYEEEEEMADELEDEDDFTDDEDESSGALQPKGPARTIRIPRFDSTDSINLFLLQEGEEEKGVESERTPMKARRQTMYGVGSPLALAQASPSVLWFESQVKVLLGTSYAKLLSNICTTEFKKLVETAIFSHKKKDHEDEPEMDKIINILDDYTMEFQSNFLHFGLSNQFFQQVFKYIDATLFNILLLRKDLCNYQSGEEIQKKLHRLEGWAKDVGSAWVGRSFECLVHVRQAAKVLMMTSRQRKQLAVDPSFRKLECPDLNVTQLKQILSLYTPAQGEEKFPLDLLAKLALQTGEKEPLIADTTSATSLVVTELHFATLEDIMTLPFPMPVKRHFEQQQRQAKARKRAELEAEAEGEGRERADSRGRERPEIREPPRDRDRERLEAPHSPHSPRDKDRDSVRIKDKERLQRALAQGGGKPASLSRAASRTSQQRPSGNRMW